MQTLIFRSECHLKKEGLRQFLMSNFYSLHFFVQMFAIESELKMDVVSI